MSDDELISRFCDGDHAAFDLLFMRHYRSVFGFARSILRDAATAEDVLQETFLAVADHAADYRPEGKFKAWIMRITRNRCLNRLATHRARAELQEQTGLRLVEPADPRPDPAATAALTDLEQRIHAELDTLPPRQRDALVLYAIEGLTYQDIADTLETPINTIKTLIRRARLSLAKTLGPELVRVNRQHDGSRS